MCKVKWKNLKSLKISLTFQEFHWIWTNYSAKWFSAANMPALAAIPSWQRIQQTREATLTNPSRVALAVHLARTCDSRSCCCCCFCCWGLLVGNVQTITQQQQQPKLKQNHRTLLDCCRALFALCFLSFSSFFLAKNLSPSAGQCSWLSCPMRLTRHRVWLSSRICGICAPSRGPALWAHSSGTLCRIMRCCRLLCLSFAVWLFGCLVVVATWSTHVRYNCVAIAVVVVGFFIRIVTGSANDRRMHRYKSIYNCAELWLWL